MCENVDDCLLKPIEAAHFLKLSRSRLAKLRLTGEGPRYMRIGRQVRYSRADLLRWAGLSLRHDTSER
jgi:predicted DNA-binding transcriptional regulator AlpA